MSAFLNLLSRTTSIHTSPSAWSAEANARYDRFNISSTSDSTYCYEYIYGITAEVTAFIQHTSELAEYLGFYRQHQAPPPDDLLEACESLGDRLLAWSLDIDKVASFSGQGATMLRIFELHAYAWYHGAVIYYLSRIQYCRPEDLADETASVAAYLHSAEDLKYGF
ncbi:uncharacterized protein LDX57_008526 [Aspergillus melleus]|uniref:uncharacterized protein n=1 Tax=Aspergillus melleus TaxID=138277 RepID=UPI001E8CBA7C|nr:uncharacterized protein LDX57_008526 [Aspergillus melleus]KAH8430862.1 hypothetical protein LDX57_008526 [Aspergillus melleus]